MKWDQTKLAVNAVIFLMLLTLFCNACLAKGDWDAANLTEVSTMPKMAVFGAYSCGSSLRGLLLLSRICRSVEFWRILTMEDFWASVAVVSLGHEPKSSWQSVYAG